MVLLTSAVSILLISSLTIVHSFLITQIILFSIFRLGERIKAQLRVDNRIIARTCITKGEDLYL